MITGVETAGLVLAAFPLLISALEHYRDAFEPLSRWWNFRTEFTTFQHGINTQRLLFDENLVYLLRPIVPLDAEMHALLQDPLGAAWRCPELEAKLKKRLPRSYQSYRDTIQDMQGSMNALQKMLNIKDGKLAWVYDPTSPSKNREKCERELQRIRLVLSNRRRGRLLKKLAANNDELQKLLASSERLAPYRKRQGIPNMFKGIRDQACGLYSVLASGWKCQCPDTTPSHYANLVLEQRTDDSRKEGRTQETQQPEATFTILFQLPRGPLEQSKRWHETETSLLETRVSTPDLNEIVDLCAALQNACQGNGNLPLGYLNDHQNRRHAFYPSVKPPSFANHTETVTLASLLSKVEDQAGSVVLRLNRGERYTVSVTLASSLLQLHSSPWIGETWSKEDVFFLKVLEGSQRPIIVDKPYISRSFTSYTPQTHNSVEGHPGHCRASTKSLLALGIMLLELCFGQAIEDQHLRKRYFGSDGTPNDMTDFSTALKWCENDALGEGGKDFYSAIRSCLLRGAIASRNNDPEDDEFHAAIYNEVVEPLERVVRHFFRTPE